MNPAGEVTVRASELTRRFGSFIAVNKVSFEVHRGEIFGFLGSNGAGKSTTIRMLCGLLSPSDGNASVGGFDVRKEPERIKQTIGYMSQKFSLYDELTVTENMEFFAGIYSIPGDRRAVRKEEVLHLLGLEDRKDMMTGLLPGGWKQRLALGCAILHEPPILFLDEPTSGVDPIARRSFWDLIDRMSGEGKTIFVTTHYMDEAEYCHRLALMDAGKIIDLDTPAELRGSLSGDVFLQLETSDTMKAIKVLKRSENIRDVAIFGGGLRVRVKDRSAAERTIREQFQREHLEVRTLIEVRPGIEDVFVLRVESSKEGGQK